MAGHCEDGQRSRAQADCCLVTWDMRLSLLGLRNPEEGVPGAHGTFKWVLATGSQNRALGPQLGMYLGGPSMSM